MINKEVKNSERERERESNNYTRATTIDLKTIDSEVAILANRSPRTPISMESLWNEVQTLKTTAKSWEIVTVSPSSKAKNSVKYTFDSKFSNYDFAILNSGQNLETDHWFTTSKGTNNFVLGSRNLSKSGTTSLTYTKSGNVITASANNGYYTYGKSEARNLTVLFYK